MNILFQSRYQYPLIESGGLGIVVYELMKELPSHCAKLEHWTWDSHTSTSTEIITGMVGHGPIADVSVPDPRLSLLFDLELTNLSMIKRYALPTFDFDLVHAHTWEVSLAAVIAKYLRKIPLVYTTHDIIKNDAHDELNETADIYEHGVLCEKIMMSEADRIVAVSEENRDILLGFYPEVASKTVVIPNGVDTRTFRPEAAATTYNDLEPGYLLFIGRTVPSKGIETVVSMLDYIDEDVQIVFAFSTKRWDGEKHPKADEYCEMIEMLRRRRPRTKLIINEWRRHVVAGLYANASITLAPSKYEPCGMVAMEAQACATPVITNSIGFMKDSVQSGVNGVLLDTDPEDPSYPKVMADAVVSLMKDPTVLKRMGLSSRSSVVDSHSWSARAEKHAELYQELILGNAS